MKKIYFKSIILLLFVYQGALAQVGIGTTTPNGALEVEASLPLPSLNKAGFLPPVVALSATNSTATTTVGVDVVNPNGGGSPATGTIVYNTNTSAAGANQVTPGYYFYNGTSWEKINSGTVTPSWSLNGNSGTTAGTNFIGTTDVQDFVIKTSAVANTPIERVRITAGGLMGLGTTSPITLTSNYLLTIKPTSTIQGGIDMVMTGGSSATGLNITAGNANTNGIAVNNTSTANSGPFYGVGSVLSGGNIVSGFSGYRNGSGLSYGLYGVNGTSGTYAPTANTWAAFLQGRTVISSEGSPTSATSTDLEVRNTTTGAAAPATVSLRQTNQLGTTGNVMGNLGFGDNYATAPQAQIQVLRDAAATSATDMPTAMTFSTTPDGSGTLTERMRISNTGSVGIGTTPNASAALDISSPTNNQGILMPRLTRAQILAITNPATGLMVYSTTNNRVCVNIGAPSSPIWKQLLYEDLSLTATKQVFAYTGTPQTFVVPGGVTSITVKIWGAGGGGSDASGGSGAYLTGILTVTPGQTLSFVVGKGGAWNNAAGTAAGYGGGGSAGFYSASGGGYSGIFNTTTVSQANALAIAGGGGGGGYYGISSYGGAGGATGGTNGATVAAGYTGGSGGTIGVGGAGGLYNGAANGNQGTALTGGNGPTNTIGGSGGGGGYYGGGSGYASNSLTYYSSGAGGGSSYVGTLGTVTNLPGTVSAADAATQAPGNADTDYIAGIGNGGDGSRVIAQAAGGNGLIVITY